MCVSIYQISIFVIILYPAEILCLLLTFLTIQVKGCYLGHDKLYYTCSPPLKYHSIMRASRYDKSAY